MTRGPLRELKDLLYRLYLEAGPPTLDEITQWISEDESLPGAPERDTVRRCLGTTELPASQHDVTSIATVLARRAGWDASDVVAKAREHWMAARMLLPLGRRIAELRDPFALHVHRVIEEPGAPPGPPAYLARAHDLTLADILGATGSSAVLIVLVGSSSTGKTRAAFEAVHRFLPEWRLHHPISPTKPEALWHAVGDPTLAPRTVLWLDELSEYLSPQGGERAAAALAEALHTSQHLVAIATIWPEDWERLTIDPSPGSPAPHPQARALLKGSAQRVDISVDFALEEVRALAELDPRVRQALEATGSTGKVTQYLAAGYALLERQKALQASHPGAWAILTAAVDARRLGGPASLPEKFLEVASPRYLDPQDWGSLPDNWFPASSEVLTHMVRGAARPLARIRPYPDEEPSPPSFLLADYLADHGRQERRFTSPPNSFWLAVDELNDVAALRRMGGSALASGRRKHAARILRNAAHKDDPWAIAIWAKWLWELGETVRAEKLFQKAANLGNSSALNRWGESLWESGDHERAGELYERATAAGSDRSIRDWAESASKEGNFKLADALFQRAHDNGDPWALWWWAASCIKRGDLARAADLAELSATSAGQAPSVWWVRTLWDAGRRQRAEELLTQAIDDGRPEALWRWAEQLWGSSEHERAVELFEKSVAAGDKHALRRWASACWRAGDRPQAEVLLNRAVEAGDNIALWWWAQNLWDAGEHESSELLYLKAANAGHWPDVARQWSAALRKCGQEQRAAALMSYGLTADGDLAEAWNLHDFAP
ncbi:tetratricopeptide repeat protein [Kitasatospora sp. MAA19]|uniref:tetratricopeptide repeat protein n=1 Tax=Kitasatospora sp. MAA19 TaxID=3035090 RepID=UPI0024758148|nr:tetratricopeptide repeat protein [Kitasatospora sp. MAA19]